MKAICKRIHKSKIERINKLLQMEEVKAEDMKYINGRDFYIDDTDKFKKGLTLIKIILENTVKEEQIEELFRTANLISIYDRDIGKGVDEGQAIYIYC